MIIDLARFINDLQQQKHEIIMETDANELNDQLKNGVAKLLHLTNIIDVISQKHGTKKEPNTYLGGSKRIYFIFCSDYLSIFLDKYSITPFNEVISSDYRGLFLDLILTSFLKNSYISLPDHTLHSLKSSNAQSMINYKRHLRAYVDKYKIIEQATTLHKN